MHIAFLLLLFLTSSWNQNAKLSSQDRTLLSQLHRQVANLENARINKRQFMSRCPKKSIPTWERLLKLVPPSSSASKDLCFTLAYYNVRYKDNLNCLYAFYLRFWSFANTASGGDEHSAVSNDNQMDILSYDFRLLYEKHHDTLSLAHLLDMRLDGSYKEGQDDNIRALWNKHKLAILRIAFGSDTMLTNITEMLSVSDDEYQSSISVHRASIREDTRAELRKLSKNPDGKVAKAAREVLQLYEKLK